MVLLIGTCNFEVKCCCHCGEVVVFQKRMDIYLGKKEEEYMASIQRQGILKPGGMILDCLQVLVLVWSVCLVVSPD